jgi:tetratricopeptide (TPR) repeat protein
MKPLLLFLLIGLAPVAAFAQTKTMIKYSTPEVRLWTDVGKDRAREVMDYIDFITRNMDRFFGEYGISSKKNNPIRCYLYFNRQDFMDQRSREEALAGSKYSYFSPSNNRITASYDEGSSQARAALVRECARPIIRRYFNEPPAWFEQGLACYFEGQAFDPYQNLISSCSDYSRFDYVRDLISRDALRDWYSFFDERPLAYGRLGTGGNAATPAFSAQAWGVFFYYLHSDMEDVEALFERFLKGMSTGRERAKLIMSDLKVHEDDFFLFFKGNHQAVWHRYEAAAELSAKEEYSAALKLLLAALKIEGDNLALLRLAAEVTWNAGQYDRSVVFWRMLEVMDSACVLYSWKICRCLVESGLKHNNSDTLDEAEQAGRRAVKASRSRDADCLAALAVALHAKGELQEALKTMRRATQLGGPNYDEYKSLEKKYSRELVESYKGKKD